MRILIVDDEPGVRRYVERALALHGTEGHAVATTSEAQDLLRREDYDAILLDIAMPGETGWEFLERLRAEGDETPVIFLTAHQSLDERVRGLRLGADDYVAKPFQPEELVARLEAVLRRRRSLPVLHVGPLKMDIGRRSVEVDGARIELSPREFDVLVELARAEGRVLSREKLLRSVWAIDFEPGTKVVEVQVARLRRKLGRGTRSDLVQTVVGEGYRLAVPRGRETGVQAKTSA